MAREMAQQQALGRTGDVQEFVASNARYMAAAVESGAYPHLAEATEASSTEPSSADEIFERTLARLLSGLG